VSSGGVLSTANSKNVDASDITHPTTGTYCFRTLNFTPHNAVVSPSAIVPSIRVAAVVIAQVSSCPAGTQVSVSIRIPGGGAADTASDSGFMILFQ
jgi:hypothetical protein